MMQTRWVCLGLAVLTLVCFGHVCLGEFIHYDDPYYITANPHVQGGLSWPNVVWAFGESCLWTGYWIPLTWLSLQADATIFGPSAAWGFHLTNVLLHVANVVAFFLVLQRMTGDVGRSAMAAALFGLHPLRVECVAWVSERKDVTSGLMLLLTVAAYLRYVDRPCWRRYSLVLAAFLLALMCKPIVVTLPFALLLLDYWPLNRLRLGQNVPEQYAASRSVGWGRSVVEKIPLLAGVAVISLITWHFNAAAVTANVPWEIRIRIALSSYLSYLENTFWPMNLAMLYPAAIPSWQRALLAAVILGAITLGALYVARRHAAVLVGWLWFLGTMFPVCGIVQVGPHALADRHTYIPHMGLALAVVWGVCASAPWQRLSGSMQKSIAALVLAGLGALTWMQASYWRNSDVLFSYTLSVTKDNYEIHHSLAAYWLEHNLEQADVHFSKAVEIEPRDFRVRLAYGLMLLNKLDRPADAVTQLREAVRIQPTDADAHYLLGMALTKLGHEQEARDHWQQSVACWTTHPKHDPALGDLKGRQAQPHVALAEFALRAGEPDEALAHLTRVLELQPKNLEAQQLMALALVRSGHWPEAEATLLQAIDLDPDNASTRGYLASAYARQGKKELAAREYDSIVQRFPDWPEKTADFALKKITQARARDPLTAQELAMQICEATGFKDARWLNTLAATQAANGAFAKARATAQQALALKPEPALANEIRDRLRLYEKDQALPVTKDEK